MPSKYHHSSPEVGEEPNIWRGAALYVASSVSWQQAAPGNGSGYRSSSGSARINAGTKQTCWPKSVRWVVPGSRLPAPKSFGGCQAAELPYHKAAPLQALGGSSRSLSSVIGDLSFCSAPALPVSPIPRYTTPAISKLVFHSANSETDLLAASCKLETSVSLSRSQFYVV